MLRNNIISYDYYSIIKSIAELMLSFQINDRLTLSPSISVNSIYEYYEYLLIRRTIILSQTDANNESIVDSNCDKPKIQTNIESEQIKSEYDQNQPSTSRGSRSELMKSAPKTILVNIYNKYLLVASVI